MIADMMSNKKLHPVVAEVLYENKISLVFITQSYLPVPKDVILNTTHFFIIKIPNKQELKEIAINHSSDAEFHGFKRLYRKCAAVPYSLIIDATLLPDNSLYFQNNLL